MAKNELSVRPSSIFNATKVDNPKTIGAKYQEEVNSNRGEIQNSNYRELFGKSQRHLENGVKAFDSVKDEANLALLYSNTGRLMRLQAHFSSVSESEEENEMSIQERFFYRKSIFNYQKALQVLGDRKYNPAVWDSVHWELSTALFAMATLLQDYPSLKNKEEAEREVTETLHKALKYCDVETPGSKQPVYQYRSAMIHHRLASLYHKCYRTSTEDEGKRKKIHQLCRLHYEKSTKLLLLLENSSEYLRVQLERVALSEFQAEGAANPIGKLKHYEQALELLLESSTVLKLISERDLNYYDDEEREGSENGPKRENEDGKSKKRTKKKKKKKRGEMEEEEAEEEVTKSKSELENELILLGYYEQRLQFVLMSLAKLTTNRNDSKKGSAITGETYKKLYGMTLRTNLDRTDPIAMAKSLLDAVTKIAESVESISRQ